ncbi:MAG: hypothetical protein HY071_06940 [Chloroflexi bacterium]|nr:hypothetical protein [Chloroflexota bacterium]
MSPVGKGELSLTKFYRLRELITELATVVPGMSVDSVRRLLGSGHKELADDLVLYAGGRSIDDPLLASCRARSADALLLLWAGLVMADHRLASVVEDVLTDTHGKLRESEFETNRLEVELKRVLPDMGTRKAATNILSYYRDSGIVVPHLQGKTIVGVRRRNPTGHAVPALVTYVVMRLRHLRLAPTATSDDVREALQVRANKWIDLSPDEFRAAAALGAGRLPLLVSQSSGARHGPTSSRQPRVVTASADLSVVEVGIEAQNVDQFAVSGAADRIAARREQPLVLAYKKWMEGKGSTLIRFRFLPKGEVDAISCDIYDKTRNNLVEAKATDSRSAIRMAIGQLIDYSRYMPNQPRLAVLTPSRPRADLEALLKSVGIAAVWRDSSNEFRDNSGGSFV